MTSSLIGVWKRIADEGKAFGVYTKTHLFVVSEQTANPNGFAATYTFDGTRIRAEVLVATDNTPNRRIEYEVQIEGDIATITSYAPDTDTPIGASSRWRKIEEAH